MRAEWAVPVYEHVIKIYYETSMRVCAGERPLERLKRLFWKEAARRICTMAKKIYMRDATTMTTTTTDGGGTIVPAPVSNEPIYYYWNEENISIVDFFTLDFRNEISHVRITHWRRIFRSLTVVWAMACDRWHENVKKNKDPVGRLSI